MKIRPAIIVIIICLLGIASSATAYILGQSRASGVFGGELDVNALQRLTKNHETFLVYFYGRSCDVCAETEPCFVEALAQAQAEGWWPRDIPVYKCERDANATVRSLYGVEGTPMYIYFFQGVYVHGSVSNKGDATEYFRVMLEGMMRTHREFAEGLQNDGDYEPKPLIL